MAQAGTVCGLGPPAATVLQDMAPQGSEGMDALEILEDFASNLGIAAPWHGWCWCAAAQGPAANCKITDNFFPFPCPLLKASRCCCAMHGVKPRERKTPSARGHRDPWENSLVHCRGCPGKPLRLRSSRGGGEPGCGARCVVGKRLFHPWSIHTGSGHHLAAWGEVELQG